MLAFFNDLIIAAGCVILLFFIVSLAHISKLRLFSPNFALSLIGTGMALGGIGLIGAELVNPAAGNHLLSLGLGLFAVAYGVNMLFGCFRNWKLEKQLRDKLRDKTDDKSK